MRVLSPERIARGFRSPNLFLREANRLYHRRGYTRPYNTAGIDIFAEDWDTLVILDACRYDMFVEQAELPGTLESRLSRGSNTVEFLQANFARTDLRDTVYVTASPQLYRNRNWIEADLHARFDVWDGDSWSGQYSTVLPGTMTDHVLEATEQFPEKRLIAHYIQPHYPFLADTDVFDDGQSVRSHEKVSYWEQVMTGVRSVSPDAVWQAYRTTLDEALPHVARLLDQLEGKTVVTSDHGNMVGERSRPIPIREWGHPPGIYTEQLVKVPWLVHKRGDRPEIRAESPIETDSTDHEAVVEQRLADLGYG